VEGLHLGPYGWFLRIRDFCGERGRYARSFIRGMLAVADSTPHRPTLGMRKRLHLTLNGSMPISPSTKAARIAPASDFTGSG
jgi:hypothetical protein